MEKKVVELFAGVGGFRVGLNNIKKFDLITGKALEEGPWNFVWSNQWEPSTKTQDAFNCYNLRFPDINNCNKDISSIDKKTIPDHSLLCGGFPCQDYSVARSLSQEKGIEGKKGVLWWQINNILKAKHPPFVLLENVDRLLKSPSKQRGRDFGIMLKCFNKLGYNVEWRVINAADYGHPQRRKRIYIFAYHKKTNYYKFVKNIDPKGIIEKNGLFAKCFPIKDVNNIKTIDINIYPDFVDFSDNFSALFENSGYMKKGIVYTTKYEPLFNENNVVLKDVIYDKNNEAFFLSNEQILKFKYLRGSKKIKRVDKSGHEYFYSEGSMSENDSLELPGRTMLTSEGTINRSTHIILDPNNRKLRLLNPVECERLNEFPDNWTNSGMSIKRRYFMMGNALVCGVINKIGNELEKIIEKE